MLPQFLISLGETLDRITPDDGCLIDAKVTDGEVVIGTLSEPLRRLWYYLHTLKADIGEKTEQHVREHLLGYCKEGSETCANFHDYILTATPKISDLENIFWITAHMEFSEHNTIGVREDWKVVWLKSVEELNQLARELMARMAQ